MTIIPPVQNVPTPGELIDMEASDLVILAVLDTALEGTVAAILVANTELLHSDPYDDCDSHSPQLCIAHRLVADARRLRAIVQRYRHAIYQSRTRAPDDHDIDF